ncbi:hypothetical protein AKJ45_02190 [candidate division MSBL1 archaeon SCGC-AAA261F19]|uniref:Transposase IS4-like domain-containing protein n=1 Tax=candidate division MSBL1 archaeon SCGC-AAA261F19 TaxID=1698275 RepID=A0A133V9S7_9EURY|nr:hypothetical protein AKJ45_02190 [candidate division MSBL1 archaeon SCGC-AAA261F19]
MSGRIIKDVATLFHPSYNSIYDSYDLAHKIIRICKDNSSAERQTRPSPDVILRRLHQVDEAQFWGVLTGLNEFLLRNILLPEDPMIAIDFKIFPYYGGEQPSLVSDPRLPGTNLGIKFAVLSVVERGKTFTLRVRQVGPLESEVSVLTEMLDYAGKLFDPKVVLLDRGFYSVPVIRELRSRNLSFIMAVRRTSPIKELLKGFRRRETPAEVDYTVHGEEGEEDVRLVFTERETEKGAKVHPFITNLDTGPERVSKLYGWRWRIETNNREFGKFLPFTTSPSMKIRRIYFALSMILYNFWIVVRGGKDLPRAYEFKKILEESLKEILKGIRRRPRPPPAAQMFRR